MVCFLDLSLYECIGAGLVGNGWLSTKKQTRAWMGCLREKVYTF